MSSNSKEQWRKRTLAPTAQRFPERQEGFQTDSGLTNGHLVLP